jgi:hypothetical protein
MGTTMKFLSPPFQGWEKVQQTVQSGTEAEIAVAVIAVALEGDDLDQAQELFTNLSNHPSSIVRGNAILGFAHLARRFRKIDQKRVISIIETPFKDKNDFVRVQASSAADDFQLFLKLKIQRG